MSVVLMCSHYASTKICNLLNFFFFFFLTLLGDQPGADFGPLITPQAKERVCSLIQSSVDEGAKLLLDGRNVKVKCYENGNFVGPTIISSVTVCVFSFILMHMWGKKTPTVRNYTACKSVHVCAPTA